MSNQNKVSTREQVLRGGTYIAVRRLVGVLLGIVGAVFITNIVGPAAYGLFNSVLSLYTYCVNIATLGLPFYLVRERTVEGHRHFHQAFWWYLLTSVLFSVILTLLVVLIGQAWVRTEGFVITAIAMIWALPLNLLSRVPMAILERELEYHRTTLVEMGSQISYYLVALPMAFSGFGLWALISGFWLQTVVLSVGMFLSARYRPQRVWNRSLLKPMLQYGLAQSSSTWLYQLRNLGPSMILLPLAGKEAAGHFALAMRFLSILSFAKDTAWRISIPALARIQDDLFKMTKVVQEGMYLQVLSLGLIYTIFSSIMPLIVPAVFQQDWNLSELRIIFIFLAFGFMVNSIFTMPASALYVVRRIGIVSAFNLTHALCFLAGASLLVPSLGLAGYGLAEFIALPPYLFLVYGMAKYIGKPDYRVTFLWLVGFSFALFAPVVSGWLYLVALPFFLNPLSIRTVRTLVQQIRNLKRTPSSIPQQASSPDITNTN